MKIRKNKKGFTLVELVVVIAILAVLAGTATVATIAILNNSRKTPVEQAADSLKSTVLPGYIEMPNNYTGDLTKKNNKDGFKEYMALSMKDVVVDANGTSVSAPADDSIHVKPSKNADLKSKDWSLTVYTKYYKVVITCDFDEDSGAFLGYTVGETEKM